MKEFIFYQEDSERWFIRIPEWEGYDEDLEMQSGGDDLLELICDREKVVRLLMSTEPFEGADVLVFDKFGKEDYEGGAFYNLEIYRGCKADLIVWLGEMIKVMFPEAEGYPDNIYFKKD